MICCCCCHHLAIALAICNSSGKSHRSTRSIQHPGPTEVLLKPLRSHTGMLEYPQRFARNIPNSNSNSSGNSTVSSFSQQQSQYPPQLPLHQNQNQNYRQLAPGSSPVHHQRQSSLQQQHHRTLSTASSCSAQHKSVTFGQPALSAPTDYSNGSSSGNSSCSAAGNAAGPQSMAGNMKHGKLSHCLHSIWMTM